MHGPSDRHSPNEQEQASLTKEEALTTFNHAAEEIRFFKSQQLHFTNCTLVGYGALAVAPTLIGDREDVAHWVRVAANSFCALVAFVTAGLVLWELRKLNSALQKERQRMYEARSKLLLIQQIHQAFPPGHRDVTVLGTALVTDAVLAIGINLLRIP
jgi:hypothetical protein